MSIELGGNAPKKIYIRVDEQGWQPGANTIGYRPLTSVTTVNDQSTNQNNGTQTGTINYGTHLGVDCAYFNGNSSYIRVPYNSSLNSTSITISCWCAVASGYSSNNRGILDRGNFNGAHGQYSIANSSNFWFMVNGDNSATTYSSMFSGNNVWTYITCTYDGTTKKIYKNGTLVKTETYTYNITGTTPLTIGGYYSSSYCFNGYISNMILESTVRTAQEISDYYDQTKGNYGL